MTFDEFLARQQELRAAKPKIFALGVAEPPATPEALADLESRLGVPLPVPLRQFLSHFGGGAFGLLEILSANSESQNYLATHKERGRGHLPPNFLPFADDSAGGYFGVLLNQPNAERIYYWNTDGGLSETEQNGILEFILNNA